MIERLDENVVVVAAKEWAKRSGKNEIAAAANAIDVMNELKTKLPTDQYARTLRKLYCEYKEM